MYYIWSWYQWPKYVVLFVIINNKKPKKISEGRHDVFKGGGRIRLTNFKGTWISCLYDIWIKKNKDSSNVYTHQSQSWNSFTNSGQFDKSTSLNQRTKDRTRFKRNRCRWASLVQTSFNWNLNKRSDSINWTHPRWPIPSDWSELISE